MNKIVKQAAKSEKDLGVHNVCGHFSEEGVVWNVLRLKPGHSIVIEAVDNNEYTLTENKDDMYADVIRSKTYFWRPLSNYDGLNPRSPNRSKSKSKISRKLAIEKMEKKHKSRIEKPKPDDSIKMTVGEAYQKYTKMKHKVNK